MKATSTLVSLIEIFKGLLYKKPLGDTKQKIHSNLSSEGKSKIPVNKDINAIIEVIKKVRLKINSNTDVIWSGFENATSLITQLDNDISNLSMGDYSSINTYDTYFLPTGDFQEISISNGWGEEYLELAKEFEKHYNNLNSPN